MKLKVEDLTDATVNNTVLNNSNTPVYTKLRACREETAYRNL